MSDQGPGDSATFDSAQQWIDRLDLVPLDPEGGYYREVFRSDESVAKLPYRYAGKRDYYTSIYYLVTPENFSTLHRLATDEIFVAIAGDPVEMLQLFETGVGRTIRIGNSGAADVEPQVCVPRRVWQGLSLAEGGRFALFAVFVAPGFDPMDYETGKRSVLTETYPAFAEHIARLTREP